MDSTKHRIRRRVHWPDFSSSKVAPLKNITFFSPSLPFFPSLSKRQIRAHTQAPKHIHKHAIDTGLRTHPPRWHPTPATQRRATEAPVLTMAVIPRYLSASQLHATVWLRWLREREVTRLVKGCGFQCKEEEDICCGYGLNYTEEEEG